MTATEVAPAPSVTAAEEAPSRRRRVLRALLPAALFLGVRQVGIIVLNLMAATNDTTAGAALRSWDGQWFLAIAAGGYDGVPPGLVDAFGNRTAETPLAFFPGYPTVVGWLYDLGFPLVASAIAVTIGCGVLCSYGLVRLGALVRGGSRRTGLVLVVLFAAAPMSVVLSMAYSEAMFCAAAVWALVFVLERDWVAAGLATAAAGLVRPTAVALVLAVGLAALVAVLSRRDGWRPWVGGALAPVGLLGYLAWVGSRTGEWNGWFTLQSEGWDSEFDGGAATVRFSLQVLGDARSVLEVTTVGLILGALALLVVAWRRRLEWPLLVYAVGVLAMDLFSNGLMNSKARLMVPAMTLLVPVAIALARRKTSTVVVVLCGLALFSSWFGAYSITAWGYAI
ncbi:hypothetical protein ACFPM7_27280 [Actinokineospora guangxiensis]|uniref:Integral membrane protein n=1 Tax=Actinokineospora guangxiensis TaxID=1490288 RepID=A0ABW0EUB7_9PSEU